MKTFKVTLAYDVPYYATVTVQANNEEEAKNIASLQVDETMFDASWDAASDTRVVEIETKE
jgi:hypothetical protein